MNFCSGDSMRIELLQPLDKSCSVYWTTPEEIITNTKRIKAFKQGVYTVKVTSSLFPNPVYDTTFVRIYTKPKAYLKDTSFCVGKNVVLDARNSGMRYVWNTVERSQKIKVENPGTYWVKISNGICSITDSINVKVTAGINVSYNPEVSFCIKDETKQIGIKVNQAVKYFWNTGAITPSISVTKEGEYWVKTSNANCGSRVDTIKVKLKPCDCEMMIPNSFTPNEDNKNDYFFPVSQCDYSYFTLTITDRWTNVVYSSNNSSAKWDGRYKGNLCPEDIYIYKIETTEKGTDKKQIRSGKVSLFR